MSTQQQDQHRAGSPQPGEAGYKPPTPGAMRQGEGGRQGGETAAPQDQHQQDQKTPPGGAAGGLARPGQPERDSS